MTASGRRFRTTFEMGLREYARTPVLLGLVLFLPAYFVGIFIHVLPTSSLPIYVPGSGRMTVQTVEIYGALLVPLMGALIGGIAGLFVMLSATDADARLSIAGVGPVSLLAARFTLIVVAGLLAVGVSLAVLATAFVPEAIVPFVLASLVLAVTYGLLGTLAGLIVSRLAGVYLMLIAPMLDVFFFQNPMIDDGHWLSTLLPGHFPTAVAVDAAFTRSVAWDPFGPVLAWLGVAGGFAALAYYRALRT